MIVIFITILLFIIYAVLILYYRQSWLQIPIFKQLQTSNPVPLGHPGGLKPQTFISIIIPARNEELNIKNCLDSIMAQSYPKNLFEVIVIDDFSTDNTAAVVTSFQDQNVSLLSLKNFTEEKINSYKKKAIEIAVSKAKGELIVTTDADCIVPPAWLQTIAAFYKKYNPAFIAAPVAYFFSSPSGEGLGVRFLKIFQSLDFITLQGITGAAVYKKFHTMCNGANLAYEKKAFLEVGGFTGVDTIASGDDMLLMHKIYDLHPDRVIFLKSSDAIVKTKAMETLRDFFNQRIRWASKADKYADKKITAVLLTVYLFNAWILILGILSCFYHSMLLWFIGLVIAKTIIELFFLYPVSKFFKQQKLLWWFAVAQPFHILYIIIAGWLGKFGSYKWKGRKVK